MKAVLRNEISRKDMLKLGVLGSAGLLLPLERAARTQTVSRLRDFPDLFEAKLPVPTVHRPVRRAPKMDYYRVTMQKANVEIIPGLQTQIWGYNGQFPGPTFRVNSGRKMKVRYINRLPEYTTVHTHGAYVDGDSDGHPSKLIPPGRYLDYWFGNQQVARTMWYHDHAEHTTAQHVYNGLAGFYLVEDGFEKLLPLPKGYGKYDIPLVIQDRAFNSDGSLSYTETDDSSSNGMFGDVILVNGKPWPKLAVANRKYRFRILNGSNARPYELALDSGEPFTVIASEGGMFTRPLRVTRLPISMAERYEVVIDFSGHKVGDRVLLKNLMNDKGTASKPENLHSDGSTANVMAFEVVRKEKDDSRIPAVLRPARHNLDQTHLPARLEDSAHTRPFVFKRNGGKWTINGKTWNENRVDELCPEGETEVWHVKNNGGGWVHPVHLHLVDFRIIERNGRAPRPWERSWKDTVFLGANEEAKLLIKWPKVPLGPRKGRTKYVRSYPFHCHNLEHEDHDMMLQFKVKKT